MCVLEKRHVGNSKAWVGKFQSMGGYNQITE